MAGKHYKAPARFGFAALFREIKRRIHNAQTRAVSAANIELIRLYWDIGRILHERQQSGGWGAAVIPRLARKLHNDLPELKGFSERNIGRMIAFYRAYPNPEAILPQPTAKTADRQILPPAVAKLDPSLFWTVPWAHHVILLEKAKDLDTRRWYMEQALANGWTRNVLGLMLDAQTHKRQGKAVVNFEHRLPVSQSDFARQTLKDPYIFDFLTLTEPFQERELEVGLVGQLEKFLLELGQGFAFVGRQFRLSVGDEDFYVDLLFYHLRLRAFVVIELKKGRFKPEYAGKLNFYCNVINDRLRHPADQQTIGLILCQEQDRLLAEYSLSGIEQPIGISTYHLTRALPPKLKSALPTVEEIETELSKLPDENVADAQPKKKGPAMRAAKPPRAS